jgi:hypothetical protein
MGTREQTRFGGLRAFIHKNKPKLHVLEPARHGKPKQKQLSEESQPPGVSSADTSAAYDISIF